MVITQSLHDSIDARKDFLCESLYRNLQSSNAQNYRNTDPAVLRRRIQALIAAFTASLTDDPVPFLSHIRQIARERISQGFALDEIQLVLTFLEQRCWALVSEQPPSSDVLKQLAIITTVIGSAKDHLARIYLEELRIAEDRVQMLEKKLHELFKGTESADWTDNN